MFIRHNQIRLVLLIGLFAALVASAFTPTPPPGETILTPLTLEMPEEVTLGQKTNFSGTGFTPNGDVGVIILRSDNTSIEHLGKADANGYFNGTVTVSEDKPTGTYTMIATDLSTGRTIAIPFTVLPLQKPTPTPTVTTTPRVESALPDPFYNGPFEPLRLLGKCGCSNPGPQYGGTIAQGPKNPCPPCQTIGSYPGIERNAGPFSVFLHNGEFYHSATDLEIPGRGFNWKFERYYRNGIIFEGPLGNNWEFNYNRRLYVAPDGRVIRMDGYGRGDWYDLDGTAPAGSYTRLVKNPDGTFTERDKNGTRVFYSRPDARGIARMTELRDRDDNRMRFEYDDQGQLVRVIDTLGRPIVYRYDAKRRLVEVEDFMGRKIKFEYDRNGDLVAVTSPVVTGAPNGNDFPTGKTTRYHYSSGFADGRLNHNLIEITAPNEVATGGPPRVRVEYDTHPTSPNVDRVLRQTIGGVNASGVPAGGTISYEYLRLGTAPPGDFNTAVFQNTVTDRNGNQTEYQFNQLGNIVQIREFTNRKIRAGAPAFFETRYEYNKDGELLRQINPEGNRIEYTYGDRSMDRFQQGNLLSERIVPDSKRGGDQTEIRITSTYEPIYNQPRTVAEARGNDPTYAPQNGGAILAERYTTTYIFDYQEGTNYKALATELGVTESEVRTLLRNIPMGLGDVNGDGQTEQIAGNVVKVIRPTVNLQADSNVAQIERGSRQPIEETYTYNRFGQMTGYRDAEGNVTVYNFYPENDPDGDGKDLTPGVSNGPFGYLREEIRDAVSSPERNSGTNPAPAQVKRRYWYDRVGNVIKEIDGRGIATEYSVNQLNQLVEIRWAADVSEALKNPEEPNWRACIDQSLTECTKGMVVFRYRTRIFYDYNNNVIKRESENRDSNNKELAGDWITYEFKYDILDNLIEEAQEGSENPREILVTKYRYDRNENRVLEISPVANLPVGHPERRPSNVVSLVFDERDLLFTSTRGGLTDQFKRLAANADIPQRNQIPNSPDISTFTRVYDQNRNLTQFIDGADNNGDGRPETTTYLYDGFDRPVSVINAVGSQSFTNYDPASNVVRASRFGSLGRPSPRNDRAATFAQPFTLQSFRQPLLSQVEYKYDELSRMFERNDRLFVYQGVEYKRAPVLKDGPLGQTNDGLVTTRYEYDRKSRRTILIEDDLSVFQTRYDGVDRVIGEIDPELNEVLYTYDDNNNIVKVVEVEITQQSDVAAGKVPDLSETFTTINVYNSLNRLIRTTDNLGQTTRYHYDSRDNLIFTSDAQHSKEAADLIADPLGLYPASTTQASASEKESWLVRLLRLFQRLFGWLFGTARTEQPTNINKPGNTMEYFYDGLNRKISEVRHLRVDGQGKNPIDTGNPANPDGLIVIDYQWDSNSRLVVMADDGSLPADQNTSIGVIESTNHKGNVTRYRYDDLNRIKQEVFDDGTINDYTYDADDNPVRRIDENGSIIRNTYDGINRLVRRDITRATSSTPHPVGGFKDPNITWQVVGTTLQEFEYDGLSRLTRSFDNNEPEEANDDATVTYAYDSLSRLLEEAQNGHAVSSRWMGDNNRIGLIYPNGRELEITFDKLDRIDRISDQQSAVSGQRPIVDYNYIGPGRVLERTYSNGVRLTYLDDQRRQDIGYDGLRRPIQLRHIGSANSLVVGFGHTYDRVNNKLIEEKLHDPSNSELYAYDSVYRATDFQRGTLSPAKEVIVTPTASLLQRQQWMLDGVGNWQQNVLTMAGVATTEIRQHSSLSEIVSRTTGGGAVNLLYDDNGNQTDDGELLFRWDYRNRLRTVTRKSDGALIAVYSYDAANRRVRKLVTNSGALNGTTHFYLDRGREIEERVGTNALIEQYVYGAYIDEALVLDRNLGGGDSATDPNDQRLFYHQNRLFSVFALTDSAGKIVEGYQYDAYGHQTVFTPGLNGVVNFGSDDVVTLSGASDLNNPYMYTGRRLDPEVNQYYYRNRYVNSTQGRFISRDPMGLWYDQANHGGPMAYVGNNPFNRLDPFGLNNIGLLVVSTPPPPEPGPGSMFLEALNPIGALVGGGEDIKPESELGQEIIAKVDVFNNVLNKVIAEGQAFMGSLRGGGKCCTPGKKSIVIAGTFEVSFYGRDQGTFGSILDALAGNSMTPYTIGSAYVDYIARYEVEVFRDCTVTYIGSTELTLRDTYNFDGVLDWVTREVDVRMTWEHREAFSIGPPQ